MKNIVQQGFVHALLIVILAVLGIAGVGTVTAANNSTPGSPLFGLDKALEEVKVNLASNEHSKAKIKLEITRERLDELQRLVGANQPVDAALNEVQLALVNATSSVTSVETKFKENKITLESTDLQALLSQLQNVLTTHQGLIRKVEIKVKDEGIRAKIKFFEEEASESAKLVEEDLDDLEDDGELNESLEDKDGKEEKEEDAGSSGRGSSDSSGKNDKEDEN